MEIHLENTGTTCQTEIKQGRI